MHSRSRGAPRGMRGSRGGPGGMRGPPPRGKFIGLFKIMGCVFIVVCNILLFFLNRLLRF